MNDLLAICQKFYKTAQAVDYNSVLALKNWMKTIPYSYGGKSGTLFGTLAINDFNELKVNRNSGLFTRVLNTATQGKISGTVDIKLIISGNGITTLGGTPGQLVAELNTTLLPVIQQGFASLKGKGLKLPPSGIKFDWIQFTLPPPAADTIENSSESANISSQDVKSGNLT